MSQEKEFKTFDGLDLDIMIGDDSDVRFDVYMNQEFWLRKKDAIDLANFILENIK